MGRGFPRMGAWILATAFISSFGAGVRAQTAPRTADTPSAAAPTPPDTSLAAALAAARPPVEGVVLAVGAARVRRPKDVVLPGVQPSMTEVADLYGRLVRLYGVVTAVAPAKITVVYSPPETPNPYDGMPAGQVLKLLAATFTPAQWKAFLGTTGVGYTDLPGDTQRRLFEALFPDGRLSVEKDNPTGPNDPATRRDITGDALTQARLRLGFLTSLALQYTGKPDEYVFAGSYEPPDAPTRYIMTNTQAREADREYGATVRESVDNTPKSSDLRLSDAALRAAVPLDGVKTVDDLLARIVAAAHAEIYADPRYGKRIVTLIGPAHSAPAADLLGALALCVGGAYRRVGPAYVLTDDLAGLGTKHVLWKAFEDKAEALLPGGGSPFSQPTPAQTAGFTVKDIPWGEDPLAFTAAQQQQFWQEWAKNPMRSSLPVLDLTLPFDRLSPAQQDAARHTEEQDRKQKLDVTTDGTVMVQAEPELEITLPSLDGPVLVFESFQGLLPYPSLTPEQQAVQAKRFERDDAFFPRPGASPQPKGPLKPVVQGFTRRAVRLAAKRVEDLPLAALQTLGFNEVWLQITPGPDPAGDAATVTLLTQSVQAARSHGLTVWPEVRLLAWGPDAPPALRDRDIVGRTAAEAAKASRFPMPPTSDTVTPFAPAVVDRLTMLLHKLGSVPGIGGMVWGDTAPNGYQTFTPDGPDPDNGFVSPLGYAEAGRLAYLRRAHADPVDVYTNRYSDERAHVAVPGFSDDFNRERALYEGWRATRAQAAQGLMSRLASSLPPSFAPGAVHRLPLLVPPANEASASRLGSWDDMRRPPPTVEFLPQRGPDGKVLMGVAETERMGSLLTYHVLNLYAPPDSPDTGADSAARALRAAARQPDRNIVLDLTRAPALLTTLAARERNASSTTAQSDSRR